MLLLTLFGGASLNRADGTTVMVQRRSLALLAVIAAAGERGITRDRLAALLWPESGEGQARNGLRQVLHQLRRSAGDIDPVVGASDLRLNSVGVACDICRYEKALISGDVSNAAELYAGPFLDGFHLGGTAEFERWVEDERSRFARSYAQVLERLATEADQKAQTSAAVDRWRRLTVHEPLSGHAALGYMRALAANGDTATALQYARTYAALVREELGTECSADISKFVTDLISRTLPTR